jgi:hypothetical protein
LKLVVGGGFGLYLKRNHLKETGDQTLLTTWPQERSTNDIDLFLPIKMLDSTTHAALLKQSLNLLGYNVISTAKHYQFAKPGPAGDRVGSVKIDLLTGPTSQFKNTSVKVVSRRAKPQPSVDLHAHVTDEALALEQGLVTLPISGLTSSGVQESFRTMTCPGVIAIRESPYFQAEFELDGFLNALGTIFPK